MTATRRLATSRGCSGSDSVNRCCGGVSMEKQDPSLSREFTEAAGSEHPQLLRADHMSSRKHDGLDNGAGDALLASSQAEMSSSGCAAAVCVARNSRGVLALPRWSPAAERATTTTATTMRSYL